MVIHHSSILLERRQVHRFQLLLRNHPRLRTQIHYLDDERYINNVINIECLSFLKICVCIRFISRKRNFCFLDLFSVKTTLYFCSRCNNYYFVLGFLLIYSTSFECILLFEFLLLLMYAITVYIYN